MAIEQKWPAVAPQLFTADGGAQGQISVADVRGFKVKQFVVIHSSTQPDIRVQVKRVTKKTGKIIVGPPSDQQTQGKAGLRTTTDLSLYLVADGAYLYAEEQDKVKVKPDDQDIATYEQEPTVARRVVHVDQFGDFYDGDNPLPVALDGDVSIAVVEVKGTNGNFVEPNADGSINVNVVQTPVTGHNVRNIYNEVAAVASGVETLIVSYTVPFSKTAVLERISSSGENVGAYKVYLNGVAIDQQRTYYGGDMNALFEFMTGTSDGFLLAAGDIISVKILHTRQFVGNFNARIQVLEIT